MTRNTIEFCRNDESSYFVVVRNSDGQIVGNYDLHCRMGLWTLSRIADNGEITPIAHKQNSFMLGEVKQWAKLAID